MNEYWIVCVQIPDFFCLSGWFCHLSPCLWHPTGFQFLLVPPCGYFIPSLSLHVYHLHPSWGPHFFLPSGSLVVPSVASAWVRSRARHCWGDIPCLQGLVMPGGWRQAAEPFSLSILPTVLFCLPVTPSSPQPLCDLLGMETGPASPVCLRVCCWPSAPPSSTLLTNVQSMEAQPGAPLLWPVFSDLLLLSCPSPRTGGASSVHLVNWGSCLPPWPPPPCFLNSFTSLSSLLVVPLRLQSQCLAQILMLKSLHFCEMEMFSSEGCC